MIAVRRSGERGHADHGWLDTRHTFSFASYQDRQHMGYRSLRVINQDVVSPGRGFGRHPHRDMEIISDLVEGSLEHRDSMGHVQIMRPGDVQVMTAGTGVTHSEMNASATEPVHFLQIWIEPNARGLSPSYEQIHLDVGSRRNRFRLIASPDGRTGRVGGRAPGRGGLRDAPRRGPDAPPPASARPARVGAGDPRVGRGRRRDARPGRRRGIDDDSELHLRARKDAELLLFDLA